MLGRRLLENPSTGFCMEPGDYARVNGVWYAAPPGTMGLLANLSKHEVTEHEDGTITVSPSIEVDGGRYAQHWHGYLERGVWREET